MLYEEPLKFVSLCRVMRDYQDNVWLSRIGDIVGNTIVEPQYSERDTIFFENRQRIFHYDGPSKNNVFAVWNWEVMHNRNDYDKDWVRSEFQADILPIRMIYLRNVQNLDELVERLHSGIPYSHELCHTLFWFGESGDELTGVLCRPEEIEINNFKATLQNTVYSLPYYNFQKDDIYESPTSSSVFLKQVIYDAMTENILDGPQGHIFVRDTSEVIKLAIFDRMTWNSYKNAVGKTKNQWKECKTLFEVACADSLYEDVAYQLECTESEARKMVDKFITHAKCSFDSGSYDSQVFASIALNNPELYEKCKNSLKEDWEDEHSKEILNAEAELDDILSMTTAAKTEYDALVSQNNDMKAELEELSVKFEKYNEQGEEILDAIRSKVSAVQNDMAEYIADLSVYFPRQQAFNTLPTSNQNSNGWQFKVGKSCMTEDDNDIWSNWEDVLWTLKCNLQIAGVSPHWTEMLSCFVYSAYLHKMPLLLAGPNAEMIGNAISSTFNSKEIDILKCIGDVSHSAIEEFYSSNFAAVQNPFHPDWINCLTNDMSNKFALWMHPFIEDLKIEPLGLYNYAYPVFTELFVGSTPTDDSMITGVIEEEFDSYKLNSGVPVLLDKSISSGFNRLFINRIQAILSDAKQMGSFTNQDLEYMFSILPLTYLKDKSSVISELNRNQVDVSDEVWDEISCFIDEA